MRVVIGIRPQHAGGMHPRLRAIGQCEEREEPLGYEWEVDPTVVRELEPL
jgi:hypothetical protein